MLLLVRAIFDAALFSLGGVILFRALIAPKLSAPDLATPLARLTWLSVAVAFSALLAWLILQTADLAAVSPSQALPVLPNVLLYTTFGRLILAQTAALLVTIPLLAICRGMVPAAILNLVLQAAHGHLLAMYGWLSARFAVDAIHLLAGSAWLGGLFPLLLVVLISPPATAARAARHFSPLGKLCVAALAASALIQAAILVGGITPLLTTPYGRTILLKSALFLILLLLALLNRYRFAPRLRLPNPEPARVRLIASIVTQTATGLAAIFAATYLASLSPTMRM